MAALETFSPHSLETHNHIDVGLILILNYICLSGLVADNVCLVVYQKALLSDMNTREWVPERVH